MDQRRIIRPLTRKVWAGRMEQDRLILETTTGTEEILWDRVEQINLGQLIEHFNKADLKDETPGGAALKMVPLLGDYIKNKDRQIVKRHNYLVCIIFSKDHQNPFRLDNSGTNFRQMLGDEACFSGLINYTLCINRIIEKSTNACLDPSAQQFNEIGRKALATYRNLETFISFAWAFREQDPENSKKTRRKITLKEWESHTPGGYTDEEEPEEKPGE